MIFSLQSTPQKIVRRSVPEKWTKKSSRWSGRGVPDHLPSSWGWGSARPHPRSPSPRSLPLQGVLFPDYEMKKHEDNICVFTIRLIGVLGFKFLLVNQIGICFGILDFATLFHFRTHELKSCSPESTHTHTHTHKLDI